MRDDVLTAIEDEITDTRGLVLSGVRRTLRRLLPDAEKWTLLPEEDPALVVLLVLHDQGLFRVDLRRLDRDSWTVVCTRVALDPMSAVVCVEDVGKRSSPGASEVRHQTWEFRLLGLDEPLRVQVDRGGHGEDFARAVAQVVGWTPPDARP